MLTWCGEKVDQLDLGASNKSTLEVGSRNLNGTVRGHFNGAYIGVDINEGRGVDMVARSSELPFEDARFDTVVSTEMLEHDRYFWLSLPEMARVLKPGGHMILTARGIGFHPDGGADYGDLWRFTPESFGHLFVTAGLEPLEILPDPYPDHPGVFGLARKP